MIIKRGYHRLKTVEGCIIEGPIVIEMTDDGVFLSYHSLQQEEATTEWVGGTFIIPNNNTIIST
jgi:hypothetical protein